MFSKYIHRQELRDKGEESDDDAERGDRREASEDEDEEDGDEDAQSDKDERSETSTACGAKQPGDTVEPRTSQKRISLTAVKTSTVYSVEEFVSSADGK